MPALAALIMTPPPLFGLLGLLALARHGGGGGDGGVGVGVGVGVGAQQPPGPIDGDAYFYGQSEPVYPSPGMTGGGTWTDAHAKALAFVGQLTLEEKVGLTTGQKLGNGCVGGIGPISRLAFPGLCLADAGQGLRGTDLVSGWPAGLHVGASWNRDLARRRAAAMGREFFAKGVNILLGPVVGPIGRVVSGGRNWEGFSPDPYLTGGMAYESVVGIQSAGVLTSTKHYIGNEQETNRSPSRSTGTEAVSSNIDDRTMHELYLWPFQDAVRAGSGNIMCSSQRENNSYGCANSKTLNGLLKTELAFQGFVVSDWGVQYAGVATALAGLDMVMPDSDLWGDRLVEAVRNGSVPDTRLNDMATRIMANWYYLKQDSLIPSPGLGLPADVSQPHRLVEARNASDRQILLDGAIEGHVLVKNTDGALPLRKPRILSIYGYSAKSPARWMPPGTAWLLGLASCDPAVPIDFITPPVGPLSQIASNGTLFVGGGSGANTPALISAPLDALQERARRDDTALFWDLSDGNEPVVQAASDACLVLVNAMASEGYDRTGLRDDYTDRLILHVAARCANTIVVMHNAGVRLVDGFVDHPNVTALLLAHLPGQDSGRALVALLHGDANPSGKLPYSLAAREEDYGAVLRPDLPSDDSDSGSGSAPTRFPQSDFVEGVFIDYRALDARNITPRYEFGFGLSYTTFSYADLTISSADSAINTGPYPTGPIQPGGPADLWDVLASVTATVTNTGAVAGADVAQLYVGIPSDDDHDDPAVPLRQLRGFRKPFLAPGASATVRFDLTRRDLSVWDVVAQRWALRRGSYAISVGPSSRQLPLRGTLTLV